MSEYGAHDPLWVIGQKVTKSLSPGDFNTTLATGDSLTSKHVEKGLEALKAKTALKMAEMAQKSPDIYKLLYGTDKKLAPPHWDTINDKPGVMTMDDPTLVPATRLHLEKLAIQIAQKLIKMVGQTKHVHYLIYRLCHHLDVPMLGGGKCVAKDTYKASFGGKWSDCHVECFKHQGHPGDHLGSGHAGYHGWNSVVLSQSQPPDFVISPELTDGEKALVKDGKPVSAIKSVRMRTGLGLKEAKDVVDAYKKTLLETPQVYHYPTGNDDSTPF